MAAPKKPHGKSSTQTYTAAQSPVKRRRRWNVEAIERTVTAFFKMGLKLITGVAIVFLVIKLVDELKNDNYMTRPFQVPSSFASDGVNGVVLAGKLTDKLGLLKTRIENDLTDLIGLDLKQEKQGETKKDTEKAKDKFGKEILVSLHDANEPSAEVEVMGVGLSVSRLAQYLRELNIGKAKKEIAGYLTIEDDSLKLNLKMTGQPTSLLAQKMSKNRYATLDTLLEKSAASILKTISPAAYAFYEFNQTTGGFEEDFGNASPAVFRTLYQTFYDIAKNNQHDPERAFAYSLWGILMTTQRFSAIMFESMETEISEWDMETESPEWDMETENSKQWDYAKISKNYNDAFIDDKFQRAVNIEEDNFVTYLLWAQSNYLRAFEKIMLDQLELQKSISGLSEEKVAEMFAEQAEEEEFAMPTPDIAKLKAVFKKIYQAMILAPDNTNLISFTVELLAEADEFLEETDRKMIKQEFLTNIHAQVLKIKATSENYYDLASWGSFLEREGKYAEAVKIYEKYRKVDLNDSYLSGTVQIAIFENHALAGNDETFFKNLKNALKKNYIDADYFSQAEESEDDFYEEFDEFYYDVYETGLKDKVVEKYGTDKRWLQLKQEYESEQIAGKN